MAFALTSALSFNGALLNIALMFVTLIAEQMRGGRWEVGGGERNDASYKGANCNEFYWISMDHWNWNNASFINLGSQFQ